MTPAQRHEIDELGYTVLPGFMEPDFLAELRARVDELFAAEGAQAGSEFKQEPHARRLANLADKGRIFRELVSRPDLLEFVEAVLGPEYKLSSLNARSTNPYAPDPQPLHTDMGLLPDARGACVCNSVWLLDGFTPDNGPTRLVPGSHRWNRLPKDAMANPMDKHPDEICVVAPAGTVVVYNAHVWHGGTANRTARPRRALHAFYVRRDLPQQQYQKRLLRPETQQACTGKLRWLLALDDPLNDQLSARNPNLSGFMK